MPCRCKVRLDSGVSAHAQDNWRLMSSNSIADADRARADRIRSARERRDWNQSDLAWALSVSPQAMHMWDKGSGLRGQSQAKIS